MPMPTDVYGGCQCESCLEIGDGWKEKALCRTEEIPTSVFFPFPSDDVGIAKAKVVCMSCPVQQECEAKGHQEREGVWGGTMKQKPRNGRRRKTARRLW